MRSFSTHLRANAVGYLALVVALSSTSAWAAATIGARDIKPDAVRSKHIKEGNVKGKHVAPGAIGASRLADGSVTTPKLANAAVTNQKLGSDAVTSANVLDGEIGPGDISIPAARVDKPLEFGVFVPNDIEVLVDLGSVIFETVPGMYDSATSTYVAPVAGIYDVTAAFIWDPNATGVRRLTIKREDGVDDYVIGQSSMSATAGVIQEVSGLVQLDEGDTVAVYAYQNSGDVLGYERDSRMHFDIRWVSG